jgi:hypothetical protein
VTWGEVVKDQGGKLLTGVGGGDAEDYFSLGRLLHYICRGRFGLTVVRRFRHWLGLVGLMLLFGLGFALFLQALQFVQGSVKRPFETGALGTNQAQ